MATQAQIEAARRNGARSRGPITPEGKRRSAQNSLKHGLRAAKLVVLRNESEESFDALLAACVRSFEPADEFEAELVHQIAAARWRMRRAWVVETGLFDNKMDQLPDAPDEPARLAAAFTALSDNSSAFSLVTRYETRIRRSFESALRHLREHRERKQKSSERTRPGSGC